LLAGSASAQPENTDQSRQELVVPGPVTDQQTQERFGLLTLTNPEGTCSASMLNDYWAITAAHCVFSRLGNCPQFAANQISLTANWPSNTKTVNAVQIVTYGTPTSCAFPQNMLGTPNDIALVQVGLHDFGRSDARPMKLDNQRPRVNWTLTAYGRGINALAFQVGPTAVQSQSDGQFRNTDFNIISVNPNSAAIPVTYAFPGNRGATMAGGDSGGPSYIQDWDNPLSTARKLEYRLMGVHSFCSKTCLPGKSCVGWTWVSSISQCSDAAILPVRDQILAAIEAIPPDTGYVGQFPSGVPASVLSHKRALYAVSIDEPLVAPAGAAIDTQLTFKQCHNLQLNPGCPVGPEYEEWSYDPGTHRLYHVPSGKCVNISGARRDAGSMIILYPCQDAANEKWSIVQSGTSTVWSIKSDFSGMCLHADAHPGRSGGALGRRTLPRPATLVQRPCDGSDAQKFSDVDSDWIRRNGPH
jgi:hypothetical protein